MTDRQSQSDFDFDFEDWFFPEHLVFHYLIIQTGSGEENTNAKHSNIYLTPGFCYFFFHRSKYISLHFVLIGLGFFN
jgi:hypothetical protein